MAEASAWLARLQSAEVTEADGLEFDAWLAAAPANGAAYRAALTVWHQIESSADDILAELAAGERRQALKRGPSRRWVVGAGGFAIAAGLAVLAIPALGTAYLADARLLQAYELDLAGNRLAASVSAAEARQLAPQESVYAVEVGNIAFERQDWAAARDAYSAAARLGTFNPEMYRNLAVADRQLGYINEARDAARAAVYLDRFDPANQALLAQMELLRP